MMETMYTRLGTSQQAKVLSKSSDRLFVVTRKPLTPLPTIAAGAGSAGGEDLTDRPSRESLAERGAVTAPKNPQPTHPSFELGKRVKKNGTTATTVRVVFPKERPGGVDGIGLGGRGPGSEMPPGAGKARIPAVRRADLRRSESMEGLRARQNSPDLDEAHVGGNASWGAADSFSQVRTMGGRRERELEDHHINCMHPHVTRVDILFKPLGTVEGSVEGEVKPKARPRRSRGLVARQLTKSTPFGSKESVQSLSSTASDALPRPGKSEDRSQPVEIAGTGTGAEGAWDSAAYTAKNTRIEFARTLHVPRPFVVRKDRRWAGRRASQEKIRLCSRHLQHARPAPIRRLPPAASGAYPLCPDHLRDPWLVTPSQRRFQTNNPLNLTARSPKHSLGVTRFRHNGMVVGPSHPHLHLAAINSVYNCNRASMNSDADTPPTSEADSLEFLDDFETYNLKKKVDLMIDQFHHLGPG